jgi:hypothetical protein
MDKEQIKKALDSIKENDGLGTNSKLLLLSDAMGEPAIRACLPKMDGLQKAALLDAVLAKAKAVVGAAEQPSEDEDISMAVPTVPEEPCDCPACRASRGEIMRPVPMAAAQEALASDVDNVWLNDVEKLMQAQYGIELEDIGLTPKEVKASHDGLDAQAWVERWATKYGLERCDQAW